MYTNKVKAVDAAGHHSAFVLSDGFVLDSTPPEAVHGALQQESTLLDGSFEDQTSSVWQQGVGTRRDSTYAKDGQSAMVMQGSIEQSIAGCTSDIVKMTFWAQSLDEAKEQQHIGIVILGNTTESFYIESQEKQWQRHIYYVHVTKLMPFTLIFKPADDNLGFYLDDVSVHPIIRETDGIDPITAHVDIIPLSRDGEGYITASWFFLDPESHITDNQWAVGTVKGKLAPNSSFVTQLGDINSYKT